MRFLLDNRTQAALQFAVPVILLMVMSVSWRTQKTHHGFGRWTISNAPLALGSLLLGLRGMVPDWVSVFVANGLLFISPILIYEGIRQFRGRPPRDIFNYGLMAFLLGAFAFFLWVRPDANVRPVVMTVCAAIVILRCAASLSRDVPAELRPGYRFTAAAFGIYGLALTLRVFTAPTLPELSDTVAGDTWRGLLSMATVVMPVVWTFGFFMMTNDRLTRSLRTAEVEMREMASTDSLTGLLNRRSFVEMSQREQVRMRRNGGTLALLVMDIDHFKHLNDTYGHLVGDAILREMAGICKGSVRATDLLARWGGEEFAVLLPDTDYAGCLYLGEKLRREVAGLSVPAGRGQARTTISVGGALWTPDDENLDSVLRRADIALYKAKRRGRNCVVM